MKIYNQDKTQELIGEELDFEKGYIKSDKLFIAHHDEVQAQEAVYEERAVEEEGGGISVYKDLISPAVAYKPAYDEYEDIQVYIPYTAEELKERRLAKLRAQREPLLNAFDKWEKAVLRGREQDDAAVMDWYRNLLDLKDSAFTEIPERVEYFL